MQLAVKTLKGGKFTVDAEPSNTIAEVKGIIEASNKELPAASMKLIHSGKILKDDQKVEECNLKPNDFLVVMITKAKKPVAAPAPAPVASSAATPATPAPAAAAEASAASATAATTPAATGTTTPAAPAKAPESEATTTTTTTATTTPAATTTASPAAADEFPAEVIANLTGMGFPEAEVKACLRASRGDPNVAVEFLMNGIPPGMESGGASAPASGTTSCSGNPLDQLRNHPQFNALKRLVQTNPSMLQQVLTQIGQQDPALLQAINENQAGFIEMMNEPVDESAAAPAPPPSGGNAGGAGAGGAADMANNLMAGGMMADPAQMSQLISSLSPTELNDMAQMMGLSPQQLQATAQMIGNMPPEQLQDFMMQAMQQGGLGGGGGGGGGGGPVAIRLSPEEQASIQRLVDMGFDRAEATQAYLACDKNEALAANLLMDGGFGFGDDGGDGGGDDAGDDMYD